MTLETGKHNKPHNRCAYEPIIVIIALALMVPMFMKARFAHAERMTMGPTTAFADIKGGIKVALDEYHADVGTYPKSLQDLLQQPRNAENWRGSYLDQTLLDPWGNPYLYQFPGKHNPTGYDLWSAGPDGKSGNADDIGNWK